MSSARPWQFQRLVDEVAHFHARIQAAIRVIVVRWLGKLLDAIEIQGLADDTAVILCTEHGHCMGERDISGKSAVPLNLETAVGRARAAQSGV